MQAALEILGIPTWHNVTMAQNTNDMAMWTKGLQAKYSHSDRQFGRPEFDQLLAHWGACTDQPANVFAEELVSAYPEAKVVAPVDAIENVKKAGKDVAFDGGG